MNAFEVTEQDLPLQRLYQWERERPHAIHLTQPLAGTVRDWTWSQAMDEARRIASYLRSLGLEQGSCVGLYSKNCAWWLIADYAIWIAGYVSVPVFPSLTPGTVKKILEHSGTRACIVGRIDNWESAKTGIPDGIPLLAFPGSPATGAVCWDEIITTQEPLSGNPVRDGHEIATLIYTSGTTGNPKGVMHSFHSLATVAHAMELHPGIAANASDRLFCYLALAHVAERAVIEANAVNVGSRVYFNDSLQTFSEDLQRARPSIFFAVPRLWVQFQLGVFARTPEAELSKLFDDPAAGPSMKKQILEQLGLDQCRLPGGSGASMPVNVIAWYQELGLDLVEGYGMTENFAWCSSNAPGDNKNGTVGRPHPGVDLRISADGEIQMRSPWMMKGYYRDPERTRETFTEDGWLKTGDKGAIDEDNRLRITGRIKEIFKTAKGKYVAPVPIENKLLLGGNIEALCVTGADLAQPLAIIMLPASVRETIFRDMTNQCKSQLENDFERRLEQLNAMLDPHERLGFIVLVADAWTQESGHVTGTLKIKRDSIDASYSQHFDTWVRKGKSVIWHGF